MKAYQNLAVMVLVLAPMLASAGGMSSVFDGGWRLTVGAVYDSGVKTDMKFSPRQTYVTPAALSRTGMTREQAQESAWGKTDGTRTTYVNSRKGATAWTDSQDAASGRDVGHDEGKTTSYRFPSSIWDGGTAFELGYAEYAETAVNQTSFESMSSDDSADAAMPGFMVQLARNLYHDEDWNWGVDAAFAFQYARRNNVIRSNSSWKIGSATQSTGYYRSSYNATGALANLLTYRGADAAYVHDYVWNSDASGSYIGDGGNDAFAAPIDLDDIAHTWGQGTTRSSAQYGSLEAEGDYENMEMMLLLQPYYDLFDWLTVNATFGAVVSRQSMEMSFAMLRNGVSEYRSNRDYSQWDVYGVAGLGLMVYYRGFTLSGDFLARFLDRDMDIRDEYYSGTVSRGNWMFRLALGYEF